MTDPTHQQLIGHLLGALEDDEQKCLDERLDSDAECYKALVRWRQMLTPLEAMRPDFEPPPGLAARTFQFVAANAPGESPTDGKPRKMSAFPLPPLCATGFKPVDIAFVSLMIFLCVALIPPAICGSRFHSRLAACQAGLKGFGLALTEYGYRQNSEPSELAANGRLTSAGVFAAGMLRNGRLSADRCNACPDAWLDVQGVADLIADANAANRPENPWKQRDIVFVSQNDRQTGSNYWSGTLRDGTLNDQKTASLPVDSPLLADAPSADLPDQDAVAYHDGRGRNMFYADGHVSFVSNPWADDSSDAEINSLSLSNGNASQIILTSLAKP
jgi:prepilin-type processing-associated H-X9-DG protein